MTYQNPIRAATELKAIAQTLGDAAAAQVEALAASAFDPDEWVSTVERLGLSLKPAALEALLALVEASAFLPRLAISRPGLLGFLTSARALDKPKSKERTLREAAAGVRRVPVGDRERLRRQLRRYKYRELFRLSARELIARAPMPEIGREHSQLAEGLTRAALSACWRELSARYGLAAGDAGSPPPGFCVLGLGKLGGEDLNFSSDIDLIYVYREDPALGAALPSSLSLAQLYTKLAEALTGALGNNSGEGFCYRVDLNLRPQGRSGAIALSMPAMLGYYESQGRTWERAALLKARPIAGDLALGEEFLQALTPFVWRRSLDLSAVDGLRELKAQIDLRGKASADDVKLGPGGIREVEFFVNALQLVHGGKTSALRERNTMRALRKLEKAGLLSGTDADALEEAYLFLRRVENRLQMVDERQTQALPSGERDRARLWRSLHFPSWSAFEAELAGHRGFVREAFTTLLGRTARDEVPDEPQLALALDFDADLSKRSQALAERGFNDPERAIAALERLGRIHDSPFGAGPSGPSLQAVKLLAEIARTPDPDQALQLFSEFLGSLKAPQGYLDLLTRLPQASRRLLNLFGQSDYLSRSFLRHPELLDALVQPGLESHKDPLRMRRELLSRTNRHPDPEEKLSSMRRFKNEEVLRIGLDDIAGELTVPEVAVQLSAIADGIIDESLFIAEGEQRERYGPPREGNQLATLTVIAMGKLGGRELGYHSDLDLIFVYSGRGDSETSGGTRGKITHHEYFAKAVQRLLTFLQIQLREGLLYKVDARLRPSGNQGLLVVSEEAFRDHHERRAQLWQRQALIKARGVAGDFALFERIRLDTLESQVYLKPLPENAAEEIDRLRTRMEKEVGRETSEHLNLKLGHGGLVDVEFATQYLQLVHGGALPSVRLQGTLAALTALREAGCLDSASADTLHQGYHFLRRVENRLRLVHGEPLSSMPTSGRPLALLARRLGYLGSDPGPQFLGEYRAYTDRVRAVYARVFRRS